MIDGDVVWPNKRYMSIERGILYDGCYWFVDINSNILCSYNLNTGILYYVLDLSKYHKEYNTIRLYSLATIYKNRAIIFPVAGNSLLDVNLDTLDVAKIQVNIPNNDETFSDGSSVKFRNTCIIEGILWILPISCKYILSYDLETRSLMFMTDWYKPLEKYEWEKQIIFGQGIYDNNSIWLPSYNTNILVEVQISTMCTRIYNIGRKNNIFPTICSVNGKFWLLDNKNRELYIWSKKNGVEDILKNFPFEYGLEEQYVVLNPEYKHDNVEAAKVVGNYIVYLPGYANKYLIVNYITKEIETISGKPSGAYHVFAEQIDDNIIMFGSQLTSELMILDISKKKVFQILSSYDKLEGFPNEKITNENSNLNLANYIDYIVNS